MENPLAGAGAIEVGDLGTGILSDVYLSGVWVASLDRLARMARAVGEPALADSAMAIRAKAATTMERRLWMPQRRQYAFALLEGGAVNESLTAWPATAMAFDVLDRAHGADMAARLASADIMTDWGARPLSATSPLFDPLHYNNGAVWPFVTGWVALAQYRYHNPLAGRFALDAVARTTFDEARGRNPEVISGRLYKPLDTAVPQQFFATSMVLTPLVRGLLGLDVDAPARRVTIAPHLPPDWDSLRVDEVPVGPDRLSIRLRREAGRLVAAVTRRGSAPAAPIEIVFSPALPLGARVTSTADVDPTPGDVHATVRGTLADTGSYAVAFEGGWLVVPPRMRPAIGDRSSAPRVLSERLAGERYTIALEGLAGRTYRFRVRAPRAVPAAALEVAAGAGGRATAVPGDGAASAERVVDVTFPSAGASADGYTALTVSFGLRGASGAAPR
jgi:hypothetical protein